MNIIIYTKTGCPWCKDVLALLREKHIPFEEREVLSNPEFYKELVEKTKQTKTPSLDIDGFILADSDKDQVSEYLKQLRTH
jgi:glutaredoxin 3